MSNNNNTNDYRERERYVLELYNQGKSTREITKELRISLLDIGFILKKGQVNHGITATIDDGDNINSSNNNKPANEKATKAYKLFSEGKKPVDVAIQLNLSENLSNALSLSTAILNGVKTISNIVSLVYLIHTLILKCAIQYVTFQFIYNYFTIVTYDAISK